jgi:Ca2+-transporting ATPase
MRTNDTPLASGDKNEQWQLVKSFKLLEHHPDLQTAIEIGMTDEDWKQREKYLEEYGPNELPKPEMESYFALWIGAFNDLMMILLLIAMAVLYAVGDPIAASAILVILLIATNIGAYTEYSSNKAAAELGDLPGSCLVRHANDPTSQKGWVVLSNVKLLPGMIIQLKTGDIVPADAVILTMKGDCSCTEAMLTGESEPVAKFPFHHGISHDDEHVEDKREGMTRLYMGTEFSGDCVAMVVETGERTQMGQIFKAMADEDPDLSPLQKMIDRLIWVLAMLSIAASAVNAAICIPTERGIEPDEEDPAALVCTLNSVALTVAAVPENLPVALVIALAAIIKNLSTRGVIVKSLPAGEELSRLNYVFSDKTGTLTKNIMTARAVVTLKGYVGLSDDFVGPDESTHTEVTPLADQIRMLAGKAQDDVRSNPTGDACKKAVPENDTMERVLLEPASSKTKMARVAVNINDQNFLAKVGSDWVLNAVSTQATEKTDMANWDDSTIEPFDMAVCMEKINTWAKGGYRVICVVAKPVNSLPEEIIEGEDDDFGEGFTFLGCLAIQDPPREDVAQNIRIIRGAGVVVTMITGDNPITGMSIAQQVGLASDFTEEDIQMCLINAFELFHGLTEEAAKREIIKRLHYSMTHQKGLIIGRVSPFQKKWFVEVAKAMGLVVAMTGDGANDAPALKTANVGIAMGNGSDIAKAAGDMILVNQSFTGIVEAIRAGRLGFDNILKFLLFLLGTNISEVVVYLILTSANIVIVLDALNLLVLNLLTDGFPAIALSLEHAEGDLMKRAPLKRDTSVLNRFTYMSITITNLALLGSYFTVILLGNVWHLDNIKGQKNPDLDDDEYKDGLEKVRMMFILLINISQLFLGFSHRAPDRSVFSVGFFSGKWMNYASLSSMAVIILMTHLPGLKSIMRTEYLDLRSYLLVVAMSVLPFVVHEIAKVIIFEKNNFSVYEIYKYEYVPMNDTEILKMAETEAAIETQVDESSP